jgi:hypothetical protein
VCISALGAPNAEANNHASKTLLPFESKALQVASARKLAVEWEK